MKIARLRTEGFRGLCDGTYDLSLGGEPARRVLITGATGAGKTAFLEAIACAKESVGAYGGAVTAASMLPRGARRPAHVEATWWLDEQERARVGLDAPRVTTLTTAEPGGAVRVDRPGGLGALLAKYDSAASRVEYFEESRTIREAGPFLGDDVDRSLRLGRDPAKHAGVIAFLRRISRAKDEAEDAPWSRFVMAFIRLTRTRFFLGFEELGGRERLVVSDRSGRGAALDELALGHEQALIFAATIVRLGLEGALLLVDTPELGHACADAPRFVADLAAIAPAAQLVMATRSAEVAAAPDPAVVIRLEGGAS